MESANASPYFVFAEFVSKTTKLLNAGPQMTGMETTQEMKPLTKSQTSDQSNNIQKQNTDPAKRKVPGISFA